MAVFYSLNIQNDKIVLDEEESRHIMKVLRKRQGDVIEVINGSGEFYIATIETIDKKEVVAKILKKQKSDLNHGNHHIGIAPTKNLDRIEWFIEKAVEIGVGGIHLIQTKRTERHRINKDRCEKIIISAMKQSKNIYQPEFTAEIKLEDILNKPIRGDKFIAHVNNNTPEITELRRDFENSILLIGPEGDFTEEEVTLALKKGYKEVGLGKSILRTETAGLKGLILLNEIKKGSQN